MQLDLGGARPKHRVFALCDATGMIRFVGADRADRPPTWRLIFRFRSQINTELARWMRTLDREPDEIVLLGSATGLHAETARAIAKMLGEMLSTIREPKTSTRARRVARIEPDGTLTIWPSQKAAADALGVTTGPLHDKLVDGILLDLGN